MSENSSVSDLHPEVLKRIRSAVEGIIKEINILENPCVNDFFLIAGYLQFIRKEVPTYQINCYLKEMGYSLKEIRKASLTLREVGWLIASKYTRSWWKLNEKAFSLWKKMWKKLSKSQMKEDLHKVTEHIIKKIGIYEREENQKLHTSSKRNELVGRDLIIWIHEGEKDRLFAAIRELPVKAWRDIYLIYDPNSNLSFFDKIASKLENRKFGEIYPVDVEAWNPEKLSATLSFIRKPRKAFDIVFSAMPRSGVVCLYSHLNHPDILCDQYWYYNKAQHYLYEEGEISFEHITRTGKPINEKLVAFGENFNIRFHGILDLPHKTLEIAIPNIVRDPTDRKTKKAVYYLKTEPKKVVYCNYNRIESILKFLSKEKPGYILLSGNRICALATGIYWANFLKSKKNPPKLVFRHIETNRYSTGVGSGLKLVLEVMREK